jgi:hypothetical protein
MSITVPTGRCETLKLPSEPVVAEIVLEPSIAAGTPHGSLDALSVAKHVDAVGRPPTVTVNPVKAADDVISCTDPVSVAVAAVGLGDGLGDGLGEGLGTLADAVGDALADAVGLSDGDGVGVGSGSPETTRYKAR